MQLKQQKFRWYLLCTILAALLVTVPNTHAMKLKFGHTMSVNDTMHQGTLKFAELVKNKTNGEITVDVYPTSQLGKDKAIIQGARMGSIDISLADPALIPGGYYIPRVHTPRDNDFSSARFSALIEGLTDFLSAQLYDAGTEDA